MKRRIIVVALCCMMLGISACGGEEEKEKVFSGEPITETESISGGVGEENVSVDVNQSASVDDAQGISVQEFFANGAVASDFEHDYDAELQTSIDAIASSASSLQQELTAVTKIAEQFDKLAMAANTQFEMNTSAKWFYVIWDKELNSLWSRISSQADAQTKEQLLAKQRNWVAMKEEVTLEYVGSSEEGGSMYPVQQFGFWEEITRNRVYVLANELAKIKGESFNMPEKTSKYGICVDDEGTGSVYSSLITRQSWEGADEAIISIYRTGMLEGTFEDNGNGKYAFTSYDGKIKGIISLNGWNGASFEVTEVDGDNIVSVGDKFDFSIAF